MTTETIRELLLAGHSNAYIVRLGVSQARVKRIRADLGLPVHKSGPTPAGSIEDLFWRRAQPTDDGHLLWPGTTGELRTTAGKEKAARVAFRIRYRREPIRQVLPDCGQPGCVHPDHVADQPMRQQYAAIFGKAA